MRLKARVSCTLFVSLLFSTGYCQLTLTTCTTAANVNNLVTNILVQGGVSISNITYTGSIASAANSQFGSFSNASTTYLGLTSGVVLSTGYVPHIAQHGDSTGIMSDAISTTAHDSDLALAAGGIALTETYDACILQFDFVPMGDTVSFTYVFGSEEEPCWVCSQYDDVFGFFLSGPGIAGPYSRGGVNIALIPGTTYPVSVNTVNDGSVGTRVSTSHCPPYGLGYSAYYINNLPDPNIVCGGLTTVLTAKHSVIPCKTYHIKLAICDTHNGLYDSDVFLGANSFSVSSAASVQSAYSNSAFGNNAIKGCSNGLFVFTLPSAIATNDTVNYIISGTAVNGVDYNTIPNSAIIPAGQDTAKVIIQPTTNGSSGTVIIGVIYTCDTIYDTINIIPYVPMDLVTSGAAVICSGASDVISVSNSNGISPYIYNWSNSLGTGTSYNVTPTATTTYVVTATDKCNQTATDNVTVTVSPPLTILVSPSSASVCPGDSTQLEASGATTYSWSPGTGLSSVTDSIVTVTPPTTETYTVTGFNSAGCSGSATVTVSIASSAIITVTPPNPVLCPNTSVVLTAHGAGNYTWTPGTGLSATTGASVTANPTTTTTYTVNGSVGTCTGVGSVVVTVVPNPVITVTPNSPSICPGASVSLSASGASTYSWSPGTGLSATTGANVLANPLTSQTYTVSGTDANGCTSDTIVTVNVAPFTVTVTKTDENCGQSNGTATAIPSQPCSSGWIYLWNTTPPQTTVTATHLSSVFVYTVTISCGACTASASITINNLAGPSVAIDSSTNTICGYADGDATALANGISPPFSYDWSNGQTGTNLLNVIAGTYSVTVTDSVGCTATSSITITNTPAPTATTSSINDICNKGDGSATVNASGGLGNYTYLWSNGVTTPTDTGLVQGSYTVIVSDGECTTSVSVNVGETPGPAAGFSENPRILTLLDGPVTFIDNSTGNIVNWLWNFGDGGSGSGSTLQHQYNNLGIYVVILIVTDNNGCKDTVTDTIKVKDYFTFYIPNTFTPNGDYLNDYWTPQGMNIDTNNYNEYIYDRWGNLICKTNKWDATNHHSLVWNPINNNWDPGWNGTVNNKGTFKDVVTDVYVYRIILKEFNAGLEHEYVGRISLVPLLTH